MSLLERESGESTYLFAPVPPGFAAVFTTRVGGISRPPYDSLNLGGATEDDPNNVVGNRRRVSEHLSIPESWASAKQLHGNRAVIVRSPAEIRSKTLEADALGTRLPGLPVAVFVADCVPIALVGRGAIGAVHAGWRGITQGVVESAVGALEGPVSAWLGPSIGPCHYEVGEEVTARFRARYPDAPDPTVTVRKRIHFDLRAAARWLLESGGSVIADEDEPPCTYCDSRFYSFRRDGETGRQALIVWRNSGGEQ